MRRVGITGIGILSGAAIGGSGAAQGLLATVAAEGEPTAWREIAPEALASLFGEGERRRLSRACQFAVGAARLALEDAGLRGGDDLGVVVGTEFGDLRSTREFVDGYLQRGPTALSPLLFPNTVMNTMAAATAIAVSARSISLTLNASTVAGELALARAAALVRAGRAEAVLAGGVDQLDPLMLETLADLAASDENRAEGAGFVVVEPLETARARGARVLGEIAGSGWGAHAARPFGVARRPGASRAIAAALAQAGIAPQSVGSVQLSAAGDALRNGWELALVRAALGGSMPPATALARVVGRHSGVAALAVLGAATDAVRLGAPAMVHAVARGGSQVCLIVKGP